jgi:harmonin
VPNKSIKPYETIDDAICRDVRIIINVAPRAKLGCGICKGPECKPGIFVQFTKDGGIARESGLRPGDQLLCCNGIDFTDILFSEAVAIMKASHTLELLVRTGAGLDLFPSESSGYNSSASSVTGDQSPCWADQNSKRLSIVREESSSSREDKRGQFWTRNTDASDFDRRKERLRAVDTPKVPASYGVTKPAPPIPTPKASSSSTNNNKTIIQLCETGTFINNTLVPIANPTTNSSSSLYIDSKIGGTDANLSIKQNNTTVNNMEQNCRVSTAGGRYADDSTRIADICFKSQQTETKTVVVEVHRNPPDRIPPPPPPNRSVSRASSSCESPAAPCTSLSSAISEELKRRAGVSLKTKRSWKS